MSFDLLLDHTCDIYHVKSTHTEKGYGLPAATAYSYPVEPDISAVRCHFSIKTGVTGTPSIKQSKPYKAYDARIKLSLPANTAVMLNDKIVDRENGYEYVAEIPRNVRNHHIIVYLRPAAGQQAL